MEHQSVLTQEVVAGLAPRPDATIVDATLGAAGHAYALAVQLGPAGTLVGIDADASALARATERLAGVQPTIHLAHHNFTALTAVLSSFNVTAVDGILADLGWRSEQFTGGGKGFSFLHDEPLIMTYGDPADYSFTAHDVVNDWDEADIANVIFAYGEERGSRRIAQAIIRERAIQKIETSGHLAAIVRSALPPRRGAKIDPATRTFQALRIVVNDELTALATFIDEAVAVLAPGGRLAIITFHSLEDRIVKHRFRELAETDDLARITRRPITATATERDANPRSRSAKLRIISRTESE